MSSVLVSYRRQDTAPQAGHIFDRLVARFGRDHVFKDVDSTRPGAAYVHVIRRTLAICDVLLVVIGPRWLQKHDGVSRLEAPRDWVRIEIVTALERNILVIPVLVDGAKMPAEEDLPEELHPLARRQALTLSETAWKSGLNQLVRRISAHQRALDDLGGGDPDARSRSAYYPFVGRIAPQAGSSRGPDDGMENRTGRGAMELRDAIEIAGADGLVARLAGAGRRPLWPIGALVTVVAVAMAAAGGGSGTSSTASAFVLALGPAATVWLALRDLGRRSVVMRYEPEEAANVRWPDSPTGTGRRGLRALVRRALRARAWRSDDAPAKRVPASEAQSHQELIDAWRRLAECAELRRVGRSNRAGSTGRKAGGGVELCDLVDVIAGVEGPGGLVTNVEIPGFDAGDHALYLLPDRLLVREGACFAELSYSALSADWQPMRFAGKEMPRDGERVGTTWERVKRNGEPDRRLRTNPEWPLMRYGRIEFASETGLRWIVLSSQARAAERVIEALRSRAKPGSIVSVRAADSTNR
ncbi:MAG: toll/interleukin-1 receptor domain-containing protein [Solirubrobacteraceae bacterium]